MLNLESRVSINGRQFVECIKGDAGLPHLFGDVPADCFGTFKRLKRRVDFYAGGVRIAALTASGVLARVSLVNGRPWYSYGDPEGCGDVSYSESCRVRDALGRVDGWKAGDPVYSYAAR